MSRIIRTINIIILSIFGQVLSLNKNEIRLSVDYYLEKNVKYICYYSCESQYQNKQVALQLMGNSLRISTVQMGEDSGVDLARTLRQWNVDIGVLLDGSCDTSNLILLQASKSKLFDAEHIWLVLSGEANNTSQYIVDKFQHLNLSIDADIAVVSRERDDYILTDVFNFGRIQGNRLEISSLGSWNTDNGLKLGSKPFKYYRRWDFHNLTLRAVSVMLDPPEEFHPELLSDNGYTPGIAAMTKITSQLLNLLKERHNFRFNYTVAERWIGSPERNTTLAVTNSLLWGEQDVSSTCARMFPQWLKWVDVCFPPTTNLQTKFYYIIPNKGVGDYENRFLTPMSAGVWWSTLAACAACAVVLAAAAYVETRPKPGLYAFFSVHAAICQQDFEDGEQESGKTFQSQGRKLTLLVVGLTSMLLYNYYTSSVVSWLLNAATPSIDSLDGLINSDLELIFEDIGYARGWLDVRKTGFAFYFSGYVNEKEDELKDKKVTRAKRTVDLLQPIDVGVKLIRSGEYAYHTEPYTASQAIARTFSDDELCELGSLQMMKPANVYIMVQKRSPYKQFFVWSLMRLAERGHLSASRLRFAGTMPRCSGQRPRALSLGQAAPAFLLLLQLTVLALLMLLAERAYSRFQKPRRDLGTGGQKRLFVG